MSNDAKADLIYAILAMDSYNRGYGRGITELEEDGPNAKIGSYAIIQDLSQAGWFTAGFYAIAYKNAATGETVISYRGTDVKVPFLDSATMGGNDPVNGYGIAVGSTTSPQSVLAVDFYRAVTQKSDKEVAAKTVLTGHSLGGGLAGYIGAVSGTQTVTFDHMPFGLAAVNRAEQLDISTGTVTTQINNVRGYYTDKEFLENVRDGDLQMIVGGVAGGVAGGLSSLFSPVVGGALAAYIGNYGGTLGGATAALEQGIVKTPLNAHYDTLNPFAPFTFYHSMNLLTTLMWNKAHGDEQWVPASQQLWDAYFDSSVADAIPEAKARTTADGAALATLQSAIAYSAISEGTDDAKPFGDTAIWSMFNDAGDLGKALKGADVPRIIKDNAAAIAKMLVQYAGKLALGDVEAAQDDAQVTEGMLTSSQGGGLLSIDMSDARWLQGDAQTCNYYTCAAHICMASNDNDVIIWGQVA